MKKNNVTKAIMNATEKIQEVFQVIYRNAAGITDSFRDKYMI